MVGRRPLRVPLGPAVERVPGRRGAPGAGRDPDPRPRPPVPDGPGDRRRPGPAVVRRGVRDGGGDCPAVGRRLAGVRPRPRRDRRRRAPPVGLPGQRGADQRPGRAGHPGADPHRAPRRAGHPQPGDPRRGGAPPGDGRRGGQGRGRRPDPRRAAGSGRAAGGPRPALHGDLAARCRGRGPAPSARPRQANTAPRSTTAGRPSTPRDGAHNEEHQPDALPSRGRDPRVHRLVPLGRRAADRPGPRRDGRPHGLADGRSPAGHEPHPLRDRSARARSERRHGALRHRPRVRGRRGGGRCRGGRGGPPGRRRGPLVRWSGRARRGAADRATCAGSSSTRAHPRRMAARSTATPSWPASRRSPRPTTARASCRTSWPRSWA